LWAIEFRPYYDINLTPFLPVFLLGSLLAFIFKKTEFIIFQKRTDNKLSKIFFNWAAALSFLSFIILTPHCYSILFSTHAGPHRFQKDFLLWGCLSACLLYFSLLSTGFIRRLMESRFMVFWGKISFSAYLFHLMIVDLLVHLSIRYPLEGILLFFSFVAAFSYLSFLLIEKPLSHIHTLKIGKLWISPAS